MSQRKSIKTYLFSIAALLSFAAAVDAQTYSGQAAVAKSTIRVVGNPVFTTALADTGDLPSNGGSVAHATASVAVPGVLSIPSPISVTNSTSGTSGGSGLAQSFATVASPTIELFSGGVQISATAVSSSTNAGTCPLTDVSSSGSVANLIVNGGSVTVLGTVNQSIAISALSGTVTGTLYINEEIVGPRSVTRNALRAIVTGPGGTTIEVIVAGSSSGINCAIAPITNLFGGRGTGLRIRQVGITDVSTILADTGILPRTGGSIADSTLPSNLGVGVLSGVQVSSGTVESASSGGVAPSTPSSTDSNSSVQNLSIDLLGGTVAIGATALTSATNCQCSALSVPTCTQSSSIAGLSVSVLGDGVTLPPITGLPQTINVSVPLVGSITLILNGRESAGAGDTTAFPLRVTTSLLGLTTTDVLVARSHSDMSCVLPPSAASVTLSGRVRDSYGRAISRASISLTDGNGKTRSTISNAFGYYSFKEIPSGDFYIVSASARRYSFSARTVSLNDNVSGFDLYPDVRQIGKVAPVSNEPASKFVNNASRAVRKMEPVYYISGSIFDSDMLSKDELKILQ